MRELNPEIKEHKSLGEQIYNSLQGDLLCSVRKDCYGYMDHVRWNDKEGFAIKISPNTFYELYQTVEEIKKKLGYTEDLEVFIETHPEVNAYSRETDIEDMPNIVVINSALYNLLNKDEMKFILGHEIGHLINRDNMINQLVDFVFPEENAIPECLMNKVQLYQQLAELSADRYGYMASENLTDCLTALYKLTSGIDLQKTNVNIEALFDENKDHLGYYTDDLGYSVGTHPVNPVRVEALRLFAEAKTQKALNDGMVELMGILLKFSDTMQNQQKDLFVASAGILISNIGGKIGKKEREHILYSMGNRYLDPQAVLKDIEKGDVNEVYEKSIYYLKECGQSTKDFMMKYAIDMLLLDDALTQDKMKFLYGLGGKLGLDAQDVADFLKEAIQGARIVLTSYLK